MEECLRSACNQNFVNYEIILINDGSKDNSSVICKEWLEQCNKIRYYEQENQGLGETRNRGVSLAKGEYVAFMDSDDWVEADYLESLYFTLVKEKAEICLATEFFQFDEKTQSTVKVVSEYRKDRFEAMSYQYPSMCWKLFKRSLFIENRIRFSRLPYEDTAVYPLLMLKAHKVSYLEKAIYHYRINTGKSITNNVSNVFRYAETLEQLVKGSRKLGIFYKNQKLVRDICLIHLASGLGVGRNNFENERYLKLLEVYKCFLEKYFPEWKEERSVHYWLWGSYNLCRIMSYKKLEYNLIKEDLPYYFGFSSIISLMSCKEQSILTPKHDNIFRQEMLNKEFNKNFLEITVDQSDYILIDLLEERYDLIKTDSNIYITKSEALIESDFFNKNNQAEFVDEPEVRLEVWQEKFRDFIKLIKKNFNNDHIILFEFYLTRKFCSDLGEKEFEGFDIDKVNNKLKNYYDFFKENLPGIIIMESPLEFNYTDGNSKYGYGPWYFNSALHRILAQKLQENIKMPYEIEANNVISMELEKI